jgi:hypothetical protein
MATKKKTERRSFAEADPAAVLVLSRNLDGHGIFDPALVTWCGVPIECATLPQRFTSDPSEHKRTIYADGCAVESLSGIYGLGLLETIARDLGAEPARLYHGRGSQARALQAAIAEKLERETPGVLARSKTLEAEITARASAEIEG